MDLEQPTAVAALINYLARGLAKLSPEERRKALEEGDRLLAERQALWREARRGRPGLHPRFRAW